jgi:hypothetical protein
MTGSSLIALSRYDEASRAHRSLEPATEERADSSKRPPLALQDRLDESIRRSAPIEVNPEFAEPHYSRPAS